MVVRDVFGRVVYNEAFPNLPIAALHLSLFLHVWGGEVSHVVVLRTSGKKVGKGVYKLSEEDDLLVLQANSGEKIILPEPELEIDDDEDGLDPGEMGDMEV